MTAYDVTVADVISERRKQPAATFHQYPNEWAPLPVGTLSQSVLPLEISPSGYAGSQLLPTDLASFILAQTVSNPLYAGLPTEGQQVAEVAPENTQFGITFSASIVAKVVFASDAVSTTTFGLESVADLRATFDELAAVWKRETSMLAFVPQIAMHWAYQQIIGMGRSVVPLILERLRDRGPDHWFWALAMITRRDAAVGTTSLRDATERWLAWGHEESLI